MDDIFELYQEIVIDHNARPRNFRKLDNHNRSMEGYNPICGDNITVYLKLSEDMISDISFEGTGCAISRASASMMTEAVKGITTDKANNVFEAFHSMITKTNVDIVDTSTLGDLEFLSGVTAFPARIKCAILSWHTLKAALDGTEDSVSTE